MKKIVCLFLVIILLCSFVPTAYAQQNYEVMCVHVIALGADNDLTYINLLINSGQAYVNIDDAAQLSGYQLSNNSSSPLFIRGNKQYIGQNFIEVNGSIWVPLESTMENLETSVTETSGVLCVKSKAYTAEKLLAITDRIIWEENYKYKITATDGFVGNTGVILSAIYNVATSNSNLSDFVMGKYDYKKYAGVFREILTTENEESVIDHLSGMDKVLSDLSFLENIDATAHNGDNLATFVDFGSQTFSEGFISQYKNISDPIGYFTDVKGLSLGNQLEIYSYISSITNVSEFHMNMLRYTLLPNTKKSLYSSYPDMIRAANDTFNYYQSESTMDVINEYIRVECESIIQDTEFEVLKSVSGIKATTDTLKLERLIIDAITSGFGLGKLSDLMSTVEKTRCISNIQSIAFNQYRTFRTKEEYALNAKYSALLYLRCCQVYGKWYDGVDGLNLKPSINAATEAINEIACVSDYDLTAVVKNEPIHVNSLSSMEYEKIYTEYMESAKWQDDYEPQDEYESDITDFKITTFKVFDLDDNGIPELWFHAEDPTSEGVRGPARTDFFCTIEGSNVIQLLSGYICGGSIGGAEIAVYYDTKTLAHVICKEGHAGGFGGSASWTEVYDFSNGSIAKVIQYQSINQIASNYVDGELDNPEWYYPSDREIGGEALFTVYYVDSEQVQKETYDRASNRFTAPINENFKLQ